MTQSTDTVVEDPPPRLAGPPPGAGGDGPWAGVDLGDDDLFAEAPRIDVKARPSAQAPASRADKLAALRRALASGSYVVDVDRVAAKLLAARAGSR